MLKNKFKTIIILMIIILSFMVPIVRAENETTAESTTNEDVSLISEDSEEVNAEEILSQMEIKEEDVFLTGEDVLVDYIVDGNLFVLANKVTIDSQIGGDVFILANEVNITNNAYVYSNLFTITPNLSIAGSVYDVYALSKNVTIDGYVYRDIKISTNTLNINGYVSRNAFVSASAINFATASEDETITSKGIIKGNLNYSSNQELSIPEGSVEGTTNFKEIVKSSPNIQSYLLSLGGFLTTVAILWLLCLWITPKFLQNTDTLLTKKTLPVIGYGVLTPIVVIISFVILVLIGITSNIGLLALALLFLLIAISSATFAITVNNIICNKLKVEKNVQKLGLLLVTAAVLWLINLIPYVGGWISFATSILGLGILVKSIIPAKKGKNIDDSKKEEDKK